MARHSCRGPWAGGPCQLCDLEEEAAKGVPQGERAPGGAADSAPYPAQRRLCLCVFCIRHSPLSLPCCPTTPCCCLCPRASRRAGRARVWVRVHGGHGEGQGVEGGGDEGCERGHPALVAVLQRGPGCTDQGAHHLRTEKGRREEGQTCRSPLPERRRGRRADLQTFQLWEGGTRGDSYHLFLPVTRQDFLSLSRQEAP